MTVGSKKFGPSSGRGLPPHNNFAPRETASSTKSIMRRTCSGRISGPTSVAGSLPTDTQLFRFFHAKRNEFFRRGLLDEQPLNRKANLAAIRVAAPDGRTGSHLKVCIRENDHGIFTAKFEHRGD